MAKESFEKQDERLMEALKSAREKKVPSGLLKGFSASVEKKIREKQPSLEIQVKPKRTWAPAWVPVFAVLIIGSLLVLRLPLRVKETTSPLKTVGVTHVSVAQLSDEIAALRELGAWTDEDEKTAGVASEIDAEDLELT
mgnify:CR=1 FL=1